jgi:hypothetical protein
LDTGRHNDETVGTWNCRRGGIDSASASCVRTDSSVPGQGSLTLVWRRARGGHLAGSRRRQTDLPSRRTWRCYQCAELLSSVPKNWERARRRLSRNDGDSHGRTISSAACHHGCEDSRRTYCPNSHSCSSDFSIQILSARGTLVPFALRSPSAAFRRFGLQ